MSSCRNPASPFSRSLLHAASSSTAALSSTTTSHPSIKQLPHSQHRPQSITMSYVIAGRAIKNEYLALGTFAVTGALAALSMGGKKADKSALPALSTGNSDEEKYIKDFIANMEKEAGQAKEAVKDAVKH